MRSYRIAPRAVLSQAGAPLSWTNEQAASLAKQGQASGLAAGCERVSKAAAHQRQPGRAERAVFMEGGDMLLVTERRRSGRATKARSALAMFAPPICRRSRLNPSRTELFSWMVVSSDPT